jgi:predicted nucleotidyltransferase
MVMQDDPTMFYRSTPERVAKDVIDALQACPVVSRVAVFGSLAQDSHDGWSDIDVLCVVPDENGAWQAASALRDALIVRWHGQFSNVRLPSGRHWFYGESVFHSLDLSFCNAVDYEMVVAQGIAGHPVTVREELDRVPVDSGQHRPSIVTISEDYAFTHSLHAAMSAIRGYLRHTVSWEEVGDRIKAMDNVPVPPARDLQPADVLNEVRAVYVQLMMDRSRYGGAR